MFSSRRNFIKNGIVAATVASVTPHLLFAKSKATVAVGLQLYSVRDEMRNDPLGTLKQLAAMGYNNAEHANYVDGKFYGYAPEEFKKILDDLGITMSSGHTTLALRHWDASTNDFTDDWKKTVDDAALIGQQYVISPWLDQAQRKDYNEYLRFMEVFNKCGELCKDAGVKFGYHNHDFEFNLKLNDKLMFDIMMENTDANLVVQQLDVGNLLEFAKPVEVIRKYPKRFESIHVKDEIASSREGHKYESAVLGTGLLNVRKVIKEAVKTGGATHLIIEQEAYQGRPPLDCMKDNLAIMKSWGY